MSTYYQYFISQDSNSDSYQVWAMDMKSPALLKKINSKSGNTIPKGNHIAQVGNYLLQWSPLNKDGQYSYRLLQFNPDAPNPLGSYDQSGNWTEGAVQAGTWPKGKFFGSRADFANPDGAKKGFESGHDLVLVSMHNFVLNWIPTDGRGTYQLFHFDHGSRDPLPAPVTPQGAWRTIESGHQLVHINGNVIDWKMATGDYSIWQFDALAEDPMSFPAARTGNWKSLGINSKHQLTVIGNSVLDWEPANNNYRLWRFDLTSANVLTGPVKQGTLPKAITKTSSLTAIETLIPKDATLADMPGTLDYMRDKIEHVIYYMVENRSFDHICGWLYAKNAPIKVIGPAGPYRGVDKNFTNTFRGKEYAITKYNNGKLTEKLPDGKDFVLDIDKQDPYHDNSDVLRQMFSKDINDYSKKKQPDMGGFAWNNGTAEVMLSYTPEQLPVINGLAKHFAISDDWFCSMPGGTDVNRAFSLTGSSLGMLNNFQNGVVYTEWSEYPHRPSIWKVLWSNGIEDFKIYNAVEWMECKFTYNLFLKGQIPSIDNPFVVGNFAPQLNQFYDDLKYGTLPKFAFLEPKWVASQGSTSYHPGNDLIPGERILNDIFNAIQESPLRDKILLVITFDEHGGIADHVPPPRAVNPYTNDSIGGFNFDIMGVRIPTILVSSWITENTVFRSETNTAYDSTSILATLLQWLGVPKSRWGLGERTNHAPTFEAVIREKKARTAKIKLPLPWDSKFPKQNGDPAQMQATSTDLPIHDLHRLVVPRMVADMTPGMSRSERAKITEEILSNAKTQAGLHKRLDDLSNKRNDRS
ncbi:MAG TPA: alkaline phosphatase family protein [Saprospiraceae bacterium]|nr:alkaline phosphatase family protein [Saprospiraceae bacterium]